MRNVKKREKFSLKQFFKPTKLKVLLTAVFLLTLPFVTLIVYDSHCGSDIIWFRGNLCVLPEKAMVFLSFLLVFLSIVLLITRYGHTLKSTFIQAKQFIIPSIISLLLSYLLACIIEFSINKIYNKKRRWVSVGIIIILSISLTILLFYPVFLQVIKPPMSQSVGPGRACMNARLGIDLSCYNPLTNEIKMTITRTEEFNLIGIQIALESSGQRKLFTIKDKQNESTLVLSQYPANYSNQPDGFGIFDIPAMNEDRKYILKYSLSNQTNIAVSPIVKVGNTEKVCDVSARIAVKPCIE